MKPIIKIALLYCIFLSFNAAAQQRTPTAVTNKNRFSKLIEAVEADPNKLEAHNAYIDAVGIKSPVLKKQYALWMKKYPKSATFPFALGAAYGDSELPEAKPYLLKAVEIDPTLALAWARLSRDAERNGRFEDEREYLKKGTEYNPSNTVIAYLYADSFKDKDKDEIKHGERILDFVKRFPTDPVAADALYNLATFASNTAYQVKIYELLKNDFPPAKFETTKLAMGGYYDILVNANAEKAAALAFEMKQIDSGDSTKWANLFALAQKAAAIKKLTAENKGPEALSLINQTKLPEGYYNTKFERGLSLSKAEAISLSGNTSAAYDSLIACFAQYPTLSFKLAIAGYGARLGKDTAQIKADICKGLDVASPFATAFNLKRYLTPGTASLANYKGKVVLLTYWFPGCGICIEEFPHFENVLKKFDKKDIAYVGINIEQSQNAFVIPFMKKSAFSFTPLEDVKGRQKGNLENKGGGAPANFLIDRQGKVVFSGFRIGGDIEEEDLTMMIDLLVRS